MLPTHGAPPLAAAAARQLSLVGDKSTIDPALAGLFASSLGPVKTPPKSRYQAAAQALKNVPQAPDVDDQHSHELGGGASETGSGSATDSEFPVDTSTTGPILRRSPTEVGSRKRRRRDEQDDLEDLYIRRLVGGEKGRVNPESNRRRWAIGEDAESESSGDENSMEEASGDDDDASSLEDEVSISAQDVPPHETLAVTEDEAGFEKSSRTVFLGNVSTLAITSKSDKKALLAHLSSFLSSLAPDPSTSHKVESLRFRSTAFSTPAIPKKAAFVKKELMGATTKSTNAYVVYSTALAAREAVRRLNGTVVLDRHLRVDGVAHPAKADHRRCIFVGNLGFVDDESLINAGDDGKKKKRKPPGDMEEGLWREFGKVGTVESVRVVRDPKTRVGKGFAYVQFTDSNAVEAALLYNDKKFPPMLPRKLRVTRAKHISKTASANTPAKPLFTTTNQAGSSNKVYTPKPNPQTWSSHSRTSKLLGRAGAARLRASSRDAARKRGRGTNAAIKTTEMVFEGHRATAGVKPIGMKISGGSGRKKGGKERTRRTARAAAWKIKGGKK